MPDSPGDPGARGSPATPRWVKALGIAGVVAVLLVVGVMLLGGGQHSPGRHAPATDSGTATASASGAVTSGTAGGPAEASEAARPIEVTALDTMAFEPTGVDVSIGEVVTFKVTNAGQAVHEFTLGDAAMQQEHADAMAHMPDGMAHDLPNSITLEPGETGDLTWRFADAGALEYACHEPGHYEAGMHGPITVR